MICATIRSHETVKRYAARVVQECRLDGPVIVQATSMQSHKPIAGVSNRSSQRRAKGLYAEISVRIYSAQMMARREDMIHLGRKQVGTGLFLVAEERRYVAH
jgi:hypothetical protein